MGALDAAFQSRSTAELVEVLARSGLDVDRGVVEELARRGSAAVPYLAEILDEEKYWWFEGGVGDGWAPISALHVLAVIATPDGLEPLLRVLHRRPNDLGDWLTEDIPSILACFGPSAVAPLKGLVSNRYLDLYVRLAATGALSLIAREHPSSRDEVVGFLHKMLLQEKEDMIFLSFSVSDLAEIRDPTSRPIIHSLFDAGKIDEDIISWDVIDDIYYRWGDERLAQRKNPMKFFSPENLRDLKRISETAAEDEDRIETAPSRVGREPTAKRKLGRNDPCPCGSGKKYRKCCLLKVQNQSAKGFRTEEIRQIMDKWADHLMLSKFSGLHLSDEAEYVKDMLEEHPEYVEGFLSGRDKDGMNPRMHIIVETVIQRQIGLNDPPEVRETDLALTKGPSLNAHEARHAVGAVFLELVWHALREDWPADQFLSEYKKRLKDLANMRTRDEVWERFDPSGAQSP